MAACSGAGSRKVNDSDVALLFTICQERKVYERSDYGEAPQFAIWLEHKETGEIHTVFVT